jgi:hypothetical protein
MSMSQARFDRIYSGINAAAKKVFGVIPIADSWDCRQVGGELRRLGMNYESSVVLGCIDTLVRAGLVNEVARGQFRREEIKVAAQPIQLKEAPMAGKAKASAASAAEVPEAKPQSSPMDVLGGLATRAANIASLVRQLSSDISDAAVEIQSTLESNEEGVLKLKQLQSLLKSIG